MSDLHDEFNDGEIDDEEDELREDFDDDDHPDDEGEENGMMNEGVNNSLKQTENVKDDDIDDLDYDIVEDKKTKRRIKRTKFVSNFGKISQNEYIKILTELSELIADSRIFVPREFENLLDCESGNSITIAKNWIKHRRIVPLPCLIVRSAPNRIPEKIKVDSLPLISELKFNDFGW